METQVPPHDSVAQLDRVTDYESVGLGFESLPGHHMTAHTFCMSCFFVNKDKKFYFFAYFY